MNNALRSGDETSAGETGHTVEPTKVARTKKPAPRVPVAADVAKGSQPFSMSYGGGTTAEYLQYMIDRGAR